MTRAVALALAAALTLSAGCGFRPVYAPAAMGGSGEVTIGVIDGGTGHYLREELVRLVGPGVPGVAAGARLDVDLSEQIARLGFEPTQAASRTDFVGFATFSMTSAAGEVIAAGTVQEVTSFNFAPTPFADIAAQTAARERVATLLAQRIREAIILAASQSAATAADSPPTP
jgi:LPS-assembly lipoprotein